MVAWLALLLATTEFATVGSSLWTSLMLHSREIHYHSKVIYVSTSGNVGYNCDFSSFFFLYDFVLWIHLPFCLTFFLFFKKLQLKLSRASRKYTMWLETGKVIHVSQVNTHGMVWNAVTTIIQWSSHWKWTSKTSKLVLTTQYTCCDISINILSNGKKKKKNPP